MDSNSFKIFNLERHETKDTEDGHVNGELTVIWRDWDNHELEQPKMMYITSVKPNEKKGPHLHTQRNSFFTCIQGEVIFVIRDRNGIYHEIKTSEVDPKLIEKMNDEEAIEYLSTLRQIGRWSAEMILLFTFNRSNIWPVQDIGLLRAISNNYKKKYLPPQKFVNFLKKKFSPYCSVATWYLWRSIDDEPIQY